MSHQVTDHEGQVHKITTSSCVAGIYEGDREVSCDRCGFISYSGPKSGGTVTQAVAGHRVAVTQTDEDRERAAQAIRDLLG